MATAGWAGRSGGCDRVAAIDEVILRAARHVAAAAVPAAERLAFRISLPPVVLVSVLGRAVVDDRSWRFDREQAAASALPRAGVMALWLLESPREVVAVARPDVSVVGGRVHAVDRPAVRWSKEALWFWHGISIPAPSSPAGARRSTFADVAAIRNLERRRVIVEVVGFERLPASPVGSRPVRQDDYGRLWRLGPLLDDEEYVVVEVVNSTPEPDGSFRRYFLRVPPTVKTPREAIAWTFEMSTREYLLAAES